MEFEYITLSSNGFNRLSDWIVVKVKDVAKVNELSIKTVSKLDIIEYIDVGSVDGGKIVEVQSMPFSKAPSRAKRIVGDNDILISTVMPNLKHYTFIKIAKSNTVASTGFAIITSYKAEPRYLYYYLISDPFMNYLSQIADAHTSAYPAFNPDIIEDAELLLPPFPVQQKITFILGSLDDKIELNHKMNKTLEQMLQAIFKHWFFDFEFPNEKGKPYKSSEGEIVYSEELGKEIPNGWDVTQISDIAKVTSGKRPTIVHEKQSTDPPVPVYGGSRIMSYTSKPLFTEQILITGRVGTLGKLFRLYLQSWPLDNTLIVIVNDKSYFELIHFFLQRTQLKSLNRGISNPLITQGDIKRQNVVLPPSNIISGFSYMCHTLFEQCILNDYESHNPPQLRDALFPKFISGEIRVNVNSGNACIIENAQLEVKNEILG